MQQVCKNPLTCYAICCCTADSRCRSGEKCRPAAIHHLTCGTFPSYPLKRTLPMPSLGRAWLVVAIRRLKDGGCQKPCRPLRTEGGDAKQPPEIGLLTVTVRKPEYRSYGRGRGMTGGDFSAALEMITKPAISPPSGRGRGRLRRRRGRWRAPRRPGRRR